MNAMRPLLSVAAALVAGMAWGQSGAQVDLANTNIGDLNVAFSNGSLTA
jgi:hypothetical protein